ncbi:hypothetical protein CEXT_570641 [Caerostris extrusa]|uniref:LAGLIDADG homing endonuclease n=1 Tax=Caerostris extrusa TaxID=172846 RepID=A0AAV4Y546_CAEEX|nr:hypothetical protein CEXT_570641 [Caerostris extrusa]
MTKGDESIGLKCGFIRSRKEEPLSAFTEFQSCCSSPWKVWKWIGTLGGTFGCLSRVSIFECNSKEIALFHTQIITVHFDGTVMESGDLKILYRINFGIEDLKNIFLLSIFIIYISFISFDCCRQIPSSYVISLHAF